MEELYSIVEFEDGLQMIPTLWLIKDKTAAYWPQFTSHKRFVKAVQKNILPEDNWPIYNVKRILATASKFHEQILYNLMLRICCYTLKIYNTFLLTVLINKLYFLFRHV